jgi:uncharacterized membrane protein YccC
MSQAGLSAPGRSRAAWPDPSRLAGALRAAVPALLFGLRLWLAVCLAFYLAFWLELDNASWAGTSAAIVCQPSLGASLRKGWYRLVGTMIGAVAIVVLTACFPQQRVGFLLGLALWGAACGLVATLLHNFAAYAAALSGYTAAIIASDALGATGGPSGEVFMLAVNRASEISLGIVCAGLVLAGTDFGGAPRRLAALFAALSAEIGGGFWATLSRAGPEPPEAQPTRRGLIGRVSALDPVIDEVYGESSQLRPHLLVLQRAVDGLFNALAGWRSVAAHLARLPQDRARTEADAVLHSLPQEAQASVLQGELARCLSDPVRLRRAAIAAVRALIALPAGTPSLRLLADQSAEVWVGMAEALDGVAVLVDDPARRVPRRSYFRLHIPDWLPPFINALRAFVAIGAVELFWIVTQWPNGAFAITFAAVGVTLLAPRADQGYALAMSLTFGTLLTAAFAAVIKFALLPELESFAGFSLALGLVLVPAGALMAQPWQTTMFLAMTANFIPLLAPANQMSYDPSQFYNSALAIVAGTGAAALAFLLLPALSPARKTRRLLALTLRDLRRLATGPAPRTADAWKSRVYNRLSALPEQAEPLQRAQLLAALSVGTEIIRLRRLAHRFGLDAALDAALEAVARGDSQDAIEKLALLDRRLAAPPGTGPGVQVGLRARGRILAMSEVLAQHAAYFDSGAAR